MAYKFTTVTKSELFRTEILKEIATEVENDKHTLSFNSARITRFINE